MIIGLIFLMFIGMVSALPTTTLNVDPYAEDMSPSEVCPDFAIGFKLDGDMELAVGPAFLTDGTYCDTENNCVYLDFYHWENGVRTEDGEMNAFDFSAATFDVQEVRVKAQTNENVYDYSTITGRPVTADTFLTAPVNPNNGKFPGISYIKFCGIPAPEFPTLALPVGMIVGMVGMIYVVRTREKES